MLPAIAAAAAAPPAGADAAPVVVHERSAPAGGVSSALKYWTPKRMREAKPRVPRPAPRDTRTAAAARAGARRAPPGGVPPAAPTLEPQAGQEAPSQGPEAATGRAYQVPDHDLPPNAVHGKVFATDRQGDFQCSATAVASANRSVLLTAGHCVRLKRFGWARRFIFIPSYRDGSGPFGAWRWRAFVAPSRWVRKRNSNFDLAAVVVDPTGGVPVQDAVGGAGVTWNRSRHQLFRSFGYPVNYFRGERMMGCHSPSRRGPDFGRGPRMVAMTCAMKMGSSGGSWTIDGQHVNSVQSLGLRNFAAGPYFGRAAARALRRAERH